MNTKFFRIIFLFGMLFFSFSCAKSQSTDLIIKEENENIYFAKGNELIFPYIELHNRKDKSSINKENNLKEGIRYLDAVTKINPNNFAAFWLKGKAYQALKDSENAYSQFNESFKLNKEDPNVARELMIECLNLGKGDEGVKVALHALSLDKNNAGLLGNLALAYLIDGKLNSSKETIEKAIQIDPKDTINLNLKQIIIEVIEGKRKKPTKISDI